MTARIISSLGRCKVLSRYGVGFDNVDIAAATAKGIWVARVPDYSIEDVSDQALALLLACVRGVAYKDRAVRAGRWNVHKEVPTHRIAGRTLGLVGYGAIARCLHRKTSGFGLARVLVADPFVEARGDPRRGRRARRPRDAAAGVRLRQRARAAGSRDPGHDRRPAARAAEAHGDPRQHLPRAGGRREGAGRDPGRAAHRRGRASTCSRPSRWTAASPLRKLENVVLSDHAGWYSEESVPELKTKAARNVAAVLAGGRPAYPVNTI